MQIRPLMKKTLNQFFAFALPLSALLAAGQGLPTRTAIELNQLQGYWEGKGAGGKCSITITGNSLHYQAGTNWHQTIFTLSPGTDPQQLHATIKDSWPPAKDAIGQVVHAIIKIEHGTLTLATFDISQEPPKTFDDLTDKYVVNKKENPKPPKTK